MHLPDLTGISFDPLVLRESIVKNEQLWAKRKLRGWSQDDLVRELVDLGIELGERQLGVSASQISRWEHGVTQPRAPYPKLLCQLFNATAEELGLVSSSPSRTASTELPGQVTGGLSRVPGGDVDRLAEETGWDPQALSHRAAAARVAHVHRSYQAAQYREVAGWLPSLMESVDALVAEGPQVSRRDALRLQCSVSIAAAKLATKVGDASAAWSAAERARVSALEADDPFGQAAAGYQLACALLKSGRHKEAERVAVDAGEAITGADPQSLTWLGSLMLIRSIIAALGQNRSAAGQRLGHAQRLAEQLGADTNIGWTAFGPTNVLIHRMSAAVALEEPQTVLAAAVQIDVSVIPSTLRGRQAQFHLDSAWAHFQLNEDPLAVIHLLDAERVAPQLVHSYHTARDLIQDLLAREHRGQVPGLRGLAQRAGVLA